MISQAQATIESWGYAIEPWIQMIALVIGGSWVWVQSTRLLKVHRARLHAEKDEQELRTMQLHAMKELGSHVTLDLNVSPISLDGRDVLHATVEVENGGTHPVDFVYDPNEPPLLVARVAALAPEGTPCFAEGDAQRYMPHRSWVPWEVRAKDIIHPGGRRRIAFAVGVSGPGLYFVSFAIQPSEACQIEIRSFVAEDQPSPRWVAEQFVQVPVEPQVTAEVD